MKAALCFAILAVTCIIANAAHCSLEITDDAISMNNGFVSIKFDKHRPAIVAIGGDFLGEGKYQNVLATMLPSGLEREDGDGTTHYSYINGAGAALNIKVLKDDPSLVSVQISGIVDDVSSPVATETWTITLSQNQRFVSISTTGETVRTATYKAVRHGFYFQATSITALYKRGVVQMKDALPSKDFFGSYDELTRLYAVGGGTAMDVVRKTVQGTGDGSSNQTVILSSDSGVPYWSGYLELLAGQYDRVDQWSMFVC